MGDTSFTTVFRRAIKEAGDFVRLPKWSAVVTAVVVAGGVTLWNWLESGQIANSAFRGFVAAICLFLVVLIVKLFAVPLAMANEASAAKKRGDEQASQKIEELEQRIASLRPPPRDPDSIYQYGQIVGRVTGAMIDRQNSLVTFDDVTNTENLDRSNQIIYRNYHLQIVGVQGMTGLRTVASPSGTRTDQNVLTGVAAKIVDIEDDQNSSTVKASGNAEVRLEDTVSSAHTFVHAQDQSSVSAKRSEHTPKDAS